MHEKAKIFAPSKVAIHKERIKSYLQGDKIYPVTIEMDLTQRCTRSCTACPYSVARREGLTLELPFIDRLFSILGPHTPGIVLSGGEPTLVPHFPQVVGLAREKGFKEIAVISNGSRLHLPEVQDALLDHCTAVRVSMYDWQDGDSEYFTETLKKIEYLRERIDNEGSGLEIGVGILTRTELNDKYAHVATEALNAGAHWVYFHPFCVDWDSERPQQADQTGVIEAVEEYMRKAPQDANIQIPYERYNDKALKFKALHGAHFLIQIGADGINYAGPEGKYEEDYALLDLNQYMEDDFLWHPKRIARLKELNSDNYRYIGTKHRPPVFSDYIEELIAGSQKRNSHSNLIFSYESII